MVAKYEATLDHEHQQTKELQEKLKELAYHIEKI